jgi:tetratricopeptide (TPR) repeat protein
MSTHAPASPPPALARLLEQARGFIEQERFSEAIAPLTEAAAMYPNNGRIQTDLGGLYLETGRYDVALEHLCRAIEINPRLAVAHWRIGVALQHLGETESAIEALELAVDINPSLADAHFRLAVMYRERGRRPEALESFRRAAKTAGREGERQFLEAQISLMQGNEDDAETHLRAALDADPDQPTANGLLGVMLSASGRFEEARRHYEAQIARSPHAGLCYYDLARSRKVTAEDAQILELMDRALTDPKLDDTNRGIVLLARGKVLDDLERYEEAMKALDEAAALRTRTHAFSIEAFERQVDEIAALFDADFLAARVSGNEDRTPIFILGMPRSGTTLVEQIVSSHPAVDGAGELAFWRKALASVMAEPGELSQDRLASLASGYLAQLRSISEEAAHVSDKEPFNFLAIGLIHLAFPRAAIVHCRRDALDTAISIHQTHFSKNAGIPTGGEELVRYFRAKQRLMDHWRRVLPEGRIFEAEYEKLTTSPQTEIMRLINHIGLYWDPACLAPHVNSRVVHTPSGWQVRQSINTGSIGRWRRYEPWLGPLAALKEDTARAG